MQVTPMGLLKRFISLCASESMINKMKRYEPQKLAQLRVYMDSPNYPWPDSEKSEVFWRTYRRLVHEYDKA